MNQVPPQSLLLGSPNFLVNGKHSGGLQALGVTIPSHTSAQKRGKQSSNQQGQVQVLHGTQSEKRLHKIKFTGNSNSTGEVTQSSASSTSQQQPNQSSVAFLQPITQAMHEKNQQYQMFPSNSTTPNLVSASSQYNEPRDYYLQLQQGGNPHHRETSTDLNALNGSQNNTANFQNGNLMLNNNLSSNASQNQNGNGQQSTSSIVIKQIPNSRSNSSKKSLLNQKKQRADSQQNLKTRISQQNLSSNVHLNNSHKKAATGVGMGFINTSNSNQFIWKGGAQRSFLSAQTTTGNSMNQSNLNSGISGLSTQKGYHQPANLQLFSNGQSSGNPMLQSANLNSMTTQNQHAQQHMMMSQQNNPQQQLILNMMIQQQQQSQQQQQQQDSQPQQLQLSGIQQLMQKASTGKLMQLGKTNGISQSNRNNDLRGSYDHSLMQKNQSLGSNNRTITQGNENLKLFNDFQLYTPQNNVIGNNDIYPQLPSTSSNMNSTNLPSSSNNSKTGPFYNNTAQNTSKANGSNSIRLNSASKTNSQQGSGGGFNSISHANLLQGISSNANPYDDSRRQNSAPKQQNYNMYNFNQQRNVNLKTEPSAAQVVINGQNMLSFQQGIGGAQKLYTLENSVNQSKTNNNLKFDQSLANNNQNSSNKNTIKIMNNDNSYNQQFQNQIQSSANKSAISQQPYNLNSAENQLSQDLSQQAQQNQSSAQANSRQGNKSQRNDSLEKKERNSRQQTQTAELLSKEQLSKEQLDQEEESVSISKNKIIQIYQQQQQKKKSSGLEKALKEEDSDSDEDEIQLDLNEKYKQKVKKSQESDRNCQVNLKYKNEVIHYEFRTKEKTVEWMFNYILRRLYYYEKKVLNNQDEESILKSLQSIVTFVSTSQNMAVTYYLTQKKRPISIFNNKCMHIQPLFYEESLDSSITQDYKEIGLEAFNLIRCIGLGGFSRVYLVQKKDTGKMYALKLIDKKFIIDNKKEVIVQNERNIMASIAHPFLLKLEYSFESQSYLGFCMEYCAGGELFYHLRRIKRMTEEMARFYFVEICLGIDYLHKRDIKPENILLDIDGHVRIGDFGLSKPDMDINDHAYSFCGSPEYMAPEMLMKVGHTYTVDFYCLGALLYELVTGLPPFYSHDTDAIYQRILSEELDFPDHVKLSSELKGLLRGLLAKHPENRLGIQNGIRDILAHPWFKPIKIGDVLEKLIEPPLKPNVLGFNFDEDEFQQGEKEFRKKLINCQIGQHEENLPTIFDEFYFDCNLNRIKKQRQLQLQQQKQLREQQQQIQNQKLQQQQQQQLQQQTQQQQNLIYQIQQQQIKHQQQQKILQQLTSQPQSTLGISEMSNFIQRKGSSSNNQTQVNPMTLNNTNSSPFSKMETEGNLPLQQINSPQLTQSGLMRNNTEISEGGYANHFQYQNNKTQNENQIYQQYLWQQMQNQNNSNNKPTHMKQSNSLGQKQKSYNAISKQHLKANSAMKLQTNNFMNNFSHSSQQALLLLQQQSQQAQPSNNTLYQQQQQQNQQNNKRMKTEEQDYEEETVEQEEQAYYNSSNRILTDINRKSRALMKMNGVPTKPNTQLQKNPSSKQFSNSSSKTSLQNQQFNLQQSQIQLSNQNIYGKQTNQGSSSQGGNNSMQSGINGQAFPQQQQQFNMNGANTSPTKNLVITNTQASTKHYNPLDFIYQN